MFLFVVVFYRFGEDAESLFNFQMNFTSDDIYTVIDALTEGQSNASNIVPALEFVRSITFSEEMGSRPNVPKLLVVISDNLISGEVIKFCSVLFFHVLSNTCPARRGGRPVARVRQNLVKCTTHR